MDVNIGNYLSSIDHSQEEKLVSAKDRYFFYKYRNELSFLQYLFPSRTLEDIKSQSLKMKNLASYIEHAEKSIQKGIGLLRPRSRQAASIAQRIPLPIFGQTTHKKTTQPTLISRIEHTRKHSSRDWIEKAAFDPTSKYCYCCLKSKQLPEWQLDAIRAIELIRNRGFDEQKSDCEEEILPGSSTSAGSEFLRSQKLEHSKAQSPEPYISAETNKSDSSIEDKVDTIIDLYIDQITQEKSSPDASNEDPDESGEMDLPLFPGH